MRDTVYFTLPRDEVFCIIYVSTFITFYAYCMLAIVCKENEETQSLLKK